MANRRPMSKLITKAQDFAIARHGSQKRKYTYEPYWYHLRNVAEIVESVGTPSETIAAAWLHDVLEDTDTGYGELVELFGKAIAKTVLDLTDFAGEGNRALRKAMDRDRLAQSSADAQSIKLADLIDNTSSIVDYDRKFAAVYLAEKEALLPCLGKGDPILHQSAMEVLKSAQQKLGISRSGFNNT